MPGSLLDMRILVTPYSEKLGNDIYNSLDDAMNTKIKKFDYLVSLAKTDPAAYREIESDPPITIQKKRDDIEKYLEQVYKKGYGDFDILKQRVFRNKEIEPTTKTNVRGKKVYLVHLFKGYDGEDEPNVGMMRLFLTNRMLHACNSTGIADIIPMIPYDRQERKDKPRVPISFRLIADLIAASNATRIMTIDLHERAEEGFFGIRVDNLSPILLCEKIINEYKKIGKVSLVNPDTGSAKRNDDLRKHTNLDAATAIKTKEDGDSKIIGFEGEEYLPGRIALIVDDKVDSGKSAKNVARKAKECGAEDVALFGTHLIGSPVKVGDVYIPAIEDLSNSGVFSKIYVTDSNFSDYWLKYPLLNIIPLGPTFGRGIIEVQIDGSISSLFPKIKK